MKRFFALFCIILLPILFAPDVVAQGMGGAQQGVVVEDDAYGAGWNGDDVHSPSQNAVYDQLHLYDTDDDGDIDTLDAGASGTTNKDLVVSGTGMSGGEDDVFPGADSDVNIVLTTDKDIVAGTGLSGGADNALPGADSDVTISVTGVLEDLMDLGVVISDGEFLVGTGGGTFSWESGATARNSLGLGDYITKEVTIYEPDQVNDEIPFFHADSTAFPDGITIVKVSIQIPSDAAYTLGFEEWDGDPPAAQNTIEDVATGAADNYSSVSTTDIDDQDIDAGDWVFLDIPSTDVDWITATAVYEVD